MPWPVERMVRTPEGDEYLVLAHPAKLSNMWSHGPWRQWASLTRDNTCWVTVRKWGGIPVVRERWPDVSRAERRALGVIADIESGRPPKGLAVFRAETSE